jgi:putative ABC transport system substrate-binding protein
MNRRDFITLLSGTVAAWPLAARAQQAAVPVVGYLYPTKADVALQMFRQGLSEAGFIEGRNVAIEYRWAEGQYDRLPTLAADLVRRQVAVIVTPGSTPATLAAKAATTTIPIVFAVANNPVRLGLVTSLARPDRNMTSVNIYSVEVVAKRLDLLHALVPKAVHIAVLVNPSGPGVESTIADILQAAHAIGLQVQVLKAADSSEIDAAFATLVKEGADALFVTPDAFFASRRAQFATLAARHAIPTAHFNRDSVEAGGLMSYAGDTADSFRQVGVYAGRILNGAKPGDLPVVQPTKFEFVINLHTARLLGLDVPPPLLAVADEVIE